MCSLFVLEHKTKIKKISHQANSANPGLSHGSLTHLRGLLTEEEIQLVVILFCTIRDELSMDKCWILKRQRERKKKSREGKKQEKRLIIVESKKEKQSEAKG